MIHDLASIAERAKASPGERVARKERFVAQLASFVLEFDFLRERLNAMALTRNPDGYDYFCAFSRLCELRDQISVPESGQ